MAHHEGITIKFLHLMLFVVVLACMECDPGFVSGERIRCIERERVALLRFKQGLIDHAGVLRSWGNDDHKKECCEWTGVECSNTGHVTGLVIQGRGSSDEDYVYGVGGKSSPALLELRQLSYLSFGGNDFGGDPIPDFIGSIKTLEHLYLVNNNFSGMIPPQLGNLTNLRTLDLSSNYDIWSENLRWLSNLSSLSRLELSWLNLSDSNWLQRVQELPSLKELHLYSCLLSDITSSASLFVNSSSTSLSVLGLSGNKLTSATFDWLFNISTSLVSIDLSDNQLDGPIPDAFGKLFLLESLDLSHNKLTGSLPASLGQLSKLEELLLSHNSLQGIVSQVNFIKLHNLKTLGLSFNRLILDLSPDWAPPFHLDYINLARCKLGPSFPTWLETQANFTWLDISATGIQDEVPKWFWSLSPTARYLNLSHNQITGPIPDISSNLFYVMDVGSNNFSGPIPSFHPYTWVVQFSQNMFSGSISSVCRIPHSVLRLLDLSNNQLGGSLPDCWEKMPRLMILNLNNNNLSGEISHALGSLRALRTLHLGGNNLFGELPSILKNCQRLKLLDVGGNRLTGNIPPWLGENYTSMTFLSLRQNLFDGSIPPAICNLMQIQMLDLSGNDISGRVPQCFDNFTSLVDKNRKTTSKISVPINSDDYIDYALVQWKGKELEYGNTLGLLKLIDLSSNRLVGNIPISFSSLRGLISLNLSRNSLTGNIDQNIGQMEMLESLDLSRNKLSGEIPIGLAQLHYLAILYLANNNLSGKIPLGTQLQGFNESVFAGNSELCGKPLKLCPEDDLRPSIINEGENIKERDDGFLGLSFMKEFGISMAFGFIVGFWGLVGSLVLKKSWRSAYFNFLDIIGNWLYVTIILFFTKFKRS